MTPLRRPRCRRGRRDEFQKRPSCCYTRHFRAREVRGPFRAMRRLRSWSGSPRSRARESIAKSTFIRKTHMIWKTFFRVFAERSPTPYFYNEISPSRGPSFHNFDSKMAKLHFWPKRGQWDPMWSEFDSIWIKFDPNWVKLGPNEAQSIFTNSRSTAQADVMLYNKRELHMYAISGCSAPYTFAALHVLTVPTHVNMNTVHIQV